MNRSGGTLVEAYFRHVHVEMPILDKDQFLGLYDHHARAGLSDAGEMKSAPGTQYGELDFVGSTCSRAADPNARTAR
jgi:hypothetical protein